MIKRLPIIRHVRWLILSWKVERYYAMWHVTVIERRSCDLAWRVIGKVASGQRDHRADL